MFRKSFVFILVVASVSIIGHAQTPEAKKDKGTVAKTFSWTIDGDGGYLGIQTQEVNKENFAKFGLHAVRGVAVEKVLENSPAAAAGIQNGDVIVRVDGEEVTSTRKLTRLISEIAPDHQTKLTVLRNGSEKEVTATLGMRPTTAFENGNFLFNVPEPMGKFDVEKLKELPQLKDLPDLKDLPKGEMPRVFTVPGGEGKVFTWTTGGGRQIGVGVTPLTKQLADHFGVDGGLMISEVRDGSPAFKAGLKAGDIIVEADGTAVKGDFDLIRTINQKKEGDITLNIVRDGKRQTISVTPEVSKDAGFVFDTDSENGLTAPVPGRLRLITPAMPATPMAAPAAMTLVRPGRIL